MNRALPSLALTAAAGMLLWNAARWNPVLRPQREVFGAGEVPAFHSMPPSVALATVALGSVSGLIADALWIRAARVKEEGRYFELVQLAEWITALEPRFTPAWSFHAWNLAYNVSAMFTEPEDRWRWVRHGIRMLRDRGLALNPGDAQLYWELGWLFQHKIGQDLDPAHAHYKSQWTEEMATLFDGPAPDYDTLASLPASREALLAEPDVAAAVEALQSRGIDPFDTDPLRAPVEAWAGISASARSRLTAWLRRERMVNDYRLLPDVMRAVDESSGPLDWRLPEAHAIYWAERGRPHAEGFVALRLTRMRFQSLAAAFRRGRLVPTVDGRLAQSPNPDLMPRVRAAYREAAETFPDEPSVAAAHRTWLIEAIDILAAFHRLDDAREVFGELHERYPDETTAGGFEPFVALRRMAHLKDVNSRTAAALVEGLCLQALVWYALGDEDRYAGYDAQARLVWRQYRSRFAGDAHWDRVRIPAYDELRRRALIRALDQLDHPDVRARLAQLE